VRTARTSGERPAPPAVRGAGALPRPPLDVIEHARRHVEVVLDEVDLLQPALREEDLVRVRDVDLAAPDAELHDSSIEKSPFGGMWRAAGRGENESPAPPLEARQSFGARPTNCSSTRFEAGVALSGSVGPSG